MARRLWASVALVAGLAGAVVLVVPAIGGFPRGAVPAGAVVGGAVAFGWAILRRGRVRYLGLALAATLVLLGVVIFLTSGFVLEGLLAVALLLVSVGAARRALSPQVRLPAVPRPANPVVVWNARSGGGKALSFRLAEEARARGIEPVELKPGDDLVELVRRMVAAGADGLAAAGGDGTQALVATIAAEHDLPFACIPAGTRNHFALDLGVDRDDVIGALDAFVDGGERVVDLAEVNGRVFVNNVSLGLYAESVQKQGYRDAKMRTILDTVPEVIGTEAGSAPGGALRWTDQDGVEHDSAGVILVSNNEYRLGHVLGSGTRPRLDTGALGVAVLTAPRRDGRRGAGRRRRYQWSAPTFEVRSAAPVPAGVDGEALVLDPPLHFTTRPRALRVRIAAQHPGASPSADLPEGLRAALALLVRVALGVGTAPPSPASDVP